MSANIREPFNEMEFLLQKNRYRPGYTLNQQSAKDVVFIINLNNDII